MKRKIRRNLVLRLQKGPADEVEAASFALSNKFFFFFESSIKPGGGRLTYKLFFRRDERGFILHLD